MQIPLKIAFSLAFQFKSENEKSCFSKRLSCATLSQRCTSYRFWYGSKCAEKWLQASFVLSSFHSVFFFFLSLHLKSHSNQTKSPFLVIFFSLYRMYTVSLQRCSNIFFDFTTWSWALRSWFLNWNFPIDEKYSPFESVNYTWIYITSQCVWFSL